MTRARRVMRAVAAVAGALLLIAGATYVAGEQTEVVVLRTFDPQGMAHETKMWVVDGADGTPWVRVANPRRGWFLRLASNPRADLVRGGVTSAVVARPHDAPEARARIDGLFRARYGLVDWWYGVLLRRHAVPIRLEPAPEDAP